MSIPFEQIAAAALAQIDSLLAEWFPAGKQVGEEYEIGNISGDAGSSLKINTRTGQWADFAGDLKGSDLIALRAEMKRIKNGEAAIELAEKLGIPIPNGHDKTADDTKTNNSETKEVWVPLPAPSDPPPIGTIKHFKHGIASVVWIYRDAASNAIFAVVRFDLANGSKEVLPLCYGRREWTVKGGPRKGDRVIETRWHFKRPRPPIPVYGLELLAARPDASVLIVEGEKACDAARNLFPDMVVVTSQGGSNASELSDWSPLATRHVVIWPDADAAGLKYAARVGKILTKVGAASVLIVEVPKAWPEGWDLADPLPAGATSETLADLVKSATAQVNDSARSRRPVILVSAGDMDLVATECENSIIKASEPVFQRGWNLVRPVDQEVPASKGRTTIIAALLEFNVPCMLDLLSRAAQFQQYDARSEDYVACNPPGLAASFLLHRAGKWKLPQITGISTTPTLRHDGSILSAAGYDAETRLYHVKDPNLVLPVMPNPPSREEAEKGLKDLQELLAGFPFVSEVDKAVALSTMITPVVRGMLPVAPLHAFKASTAGTGKSYLADVASSICTGRICPVASAGQTDEETEKRLVGLLLAGYPIISIDNVNDELGGDLLCQAIERPLIRVRPLGKSNIIEITNWACLLATGNGLRVHGDMTRRTLTCGLDAKMERPELREFKFDPVKRVLEDRGKYVAAAMNIVRGYIAAGSPKKLQPLLSFEEWSDTVRSALKWLGCADPCESIEDARDNDPELEELREVIGLWRDSLMIGDGNRYTGRDIVAMAESKTTDPKTDRLTDEFRYPEFRDALLRLFGDRGTVNTMRLGKWLSRHAGRIVGDCRLVKLKERAHGGAVQWSVRAAA